MEAKNPRIARIATPRLLELCLEGSKGSTEQQAAADSLRSLLVLHLKHKTVVIPAAMRAHMDVLISMTYTKGN